MVFSLCIPIDLLLFSYRFPMGFLLDSDGIHIGQDELVPLDSQDESVPLVSQDELVPLDSQDESVPLVSQDELVPLDSQDEFDAGRIGTARLADTNRYL